MHIPTNRNSYQRALSASEGLLATGAEAKRRRRGPPQPCPKGATNNTLAAPIMGGPHHKRVRHREKSIPRAKNTTVACICTLGAATRQGEAAKIAPI